MGLDDLAAVDAATLGTGLPPAHALAAWAAAIEGARRVDLGRTLPGTPPRTVVIVASANVFTAPIEWAWALGGRGVRVILKSARGLAAVGEALARTLPHVEAHDWRGGDLDAEAAALAGCDAVMVFGTTETIAAIRARSPAPVLGFGPRFGVAVVPDLEAPVAAGVAEDHALYDGRGCMSPAGVFVPPGPMGPLLDALETCDVRLPAGSIEPADAQARRTLATLASAVGRAHTVGSWLVVELPGAHFRPRGLPRTVCVYPRAALAPAVRPFADELGTVALVGVEEGDVRSHPALAAELGLDLDHPARVCAVGRAQHPPGDRALHDGADVLAALWAAGA